MATLMRTRWVFLGVAILALAAFPLGCHGGGDSGPEGGNGGVPAQAEGTHPLLDLSPDRVRLPFPTRYLTIRDRGTATGDRLALPEGLPREVAAALEASEGTDLRACVGGLDGFSIMAPVMIPFSDALDMVGWSEGEFGELQEPGRGFARLYDITAPGRPEAIGLWRSFIEGENVLVLRPARPLPGGHRILVCLVGPFSDRAGGPVVRPPLFDAVMQGEEGLQEGPLVDDLREVRDLIDSGALALAPSDVILAFSFWTNSRVDEMHAIREALDALDAVSPILPEDVAYQDPRTVVGKLRSPEFRLDETIPVVPAGESPAVQGVNRIDFLLRLPAQADGPLPPLIHLHGLNGSRWSSRTLDGFGVFSIDAVQHGDRIEGEPEGPYPFLDMRHPRTLRDNVRQTAADHMALARMIGHLAEDPAAFGLPDGLLAPGPVSVFGGSLGCINGTYFSSADPRVDNVVGLAGGGLFSEFLSDSVYGFFLPAAVLGLSPFERLIFWHLVQAVLDPGDPAALAQSLASGASREGRPRNVLLALAIGDRSISNTSTEALAWSSGMGVSAGPPHNPFGLLEWTLPVEGNIEIEGEVATGLLVEHEIDVSPYLRHGMLIESEQMQAQFMTFLESAVETGIGRIVDVDVRH